MTDLPARHWQREAMAGSQEIIAVDLRNTEYHSTNNRAGAKTQIANIRPISQYDMPFNISVRRSRPISIFYYYIISGTLICNMEVCGISWRSGLD